METFGRIGIFVATLDSYRAVRSSTAIKSPRLVNSLHGSNRYTETNRFNYSFGGGSLIGGSFVGGSLMGVLGLSSFGGGLGGLSSVTLIVHTML